MNATAEPAARALAGIRVIDLADELGAYASRLLADLGAEVIRIEPPGGSRSRAVPATAVSHRSPAAPATESAPICVTAFEQFVNAGKRGMTLNLATSDGRTLLSRLLDCADVLVETCSGLDAERIGLLPETLALRHPRLVHVSVTPFGRDQPRLPVDDDDLTIMAAGGLLNLGGYPDATPVVAYGGQTRFAASIFAAVAALAGLLERETAGRGRWIDVSAQECVAQALEDSIATYEMTGRIRKRLGPEAIEAGTGIYPCADGLISMVAGRVGTARAWQALVAWMIEVGTEGASALQAPEWSEQVFRQSPEARHQFATVFGAFASSRPRSELYREAQKRGIALSPVNEVEDVLADPQLRERGYWVAVPDRITGKELTFPGPPYRLSRTPALTPRPAAELGADTPGILHDQLGFGEDQIVQLREAGVW